VRVGRVLEQIVCVAVCRDTADCVCRNRLAVLRAACRVLRAACRQLGGEWVDRRCRDAQLANRRSSTAWPVLPLPICCLLPALIL
jgi:hypothetical protein